MLTLKMLTLVSVVVVKASSIMGKVNILRNVTLLLCKPVFLLPLELCTVLFVSKRDSRSWESLEDGKCATDFSQATIK